MRIRTRSIIVTASTAARQAVTFGTALVLVRLMTKETYGTYGQVQLVALFLLGILGMNLPASLYYFIPKLGSARRRLLLTQTVGTTFAVAGIVAVAMFFGSDLIATRFNNPELSPLLKVFALYPFAYAILDLVAPFMISLDRAVRAGVYTLLTVLVRGGSVIVLVAMGYDLRAALLCLLIGSLALAAAALVDMYLLSPGKFARPDLGLLWQQFMYVMPLLLATLLGVIGTQLDKLLISIYFTADQFAVYANGAIELPLVGVITGSLAAAIMPELVAMGEQGNYAGALSLWHESIRKSSLVLYPFLGYFAACAVDFVHLAYGPGYEDATWPFLLLLTVLPVRVAVFGNLLRAMNRNLPIALGAGIGLAVDVVVSLLLLWAGRGLMLSFLGPAIGSVLAVYVSVGYLIWCIGGTMAVSTRKVLPWRDLMKILSISLGAGLAAFLVRFAALPLAARLGSETGMLSWLNVSVDSAALVIRLGVQTAVFTAVLAFLIWVTGCLKPDEKELLWLPIRWAAVRFKRRPSRL